MPPGKNSKPYETGKRNLSGGISGGSKRKKERIPGTNETLALLWATRAGKGHFVKPVRGGERKRRGGGKRKWGENRNRKKGKKQKPSNRSHNELRCGQEHASKGNGTKGGGGQVGKLVRKRGT